jgi:hypothetical protein
MPAETFHDQIGPFDVRISWGQGDCVQVATRHKDGMQAIIGIVNGWLEGAGEKPVDAEALRAKLNAKSISPAFDGWHATFTSAERPAVNAMIATLRKARDQAFGKDE